MEFEGRRSGFKPNSSSMKPAKSCGIACPFAGSGICSPASITCSIFAIQRAALRICFGRAPREAHFRPLYLSRSPARIRSRRGQSDLFRHADRAPQGEAARIVARLDDRACGAGHWRGAGGIGQPASAVVNLHIGEGIYTEYPRMLSAYLSGKAVLSEPLAAPLEKGKHYADIETPFDPADAETHFRNFAEFAREFSISRLFEHPVIRAAAVPPGDGKTGGTAGSGDWLGIELDAARARLSA